MAVDKIDEEEAFSRGKENVDEDWDDQPKVTMHFRLGEVCCEANAKTIKAKLEAIRGIDEVRVDHKLKKVTIKSSKLAAKGVIDIISKFRGVQLEPWKEQMAVPSKRIHIVEVIKREDPPMRARMAVHHPNQGQIFVYTTSDCYETWYESKDARF
ncbi:uncharacterized protein LOC9647275 isoform X1 [Selaginella moellendorffii]|uniref:uncharacterized protein LOC9647275 isoform X1 n=1 Tax=Selaginella moellendorffii TaxID=88036 RepID=UPI000D1CCDF9|nr:uncharacterized protein LOC9647275 isoform X1 [Selaginella moellendorffii]|eukprot:XP_024519613.1 uncharacterized protein LOC9647275 isoform X1 [Selaginella moellendorffii]